jgi:hypothetical protein
VNLGNNQFELVDAKFSSVKDLTTANLEPTLTKNQKIVYDLLANEKTRGSVTVMPVGENAVRAGMTLGNSIKIANPVQIYVNTPTGYAIRPFL